MPSVNAILSTAALHIGKSGSPTGTYAYLIYPGQGTYGSSCIPNGAGGFLAGSATFSAGSVVCSYPTCYDTITLSFSGANQVGLLAGTEYAIVLEQASAESGGNLGVADVDPGSHPGNGFNCVITTCTAVSTADTPFIISGTTSSTPGQQTQCYGNCGASINTNSTHTINFNNSLTIFYSVQSNLNGFVVNETTRVAKTYANGLILYMGIYTVDPRCTITAAPFTPQCPGFLASTTNFKNPSKGLQSLQSNVPVVAGQFIGLAISANFAGLDINDTSTGATLFQTNGIMPNIITQFSSLGTQKTQIYGTILGLLPGQGGSGTGPGSLGTCAVTCGLIQFWNALGGDVSAGIAVFFVLFGIIGGLLFAFTRGHGNIVGIVGPLMLFVSMLLLIMLSAAGVLPVYIPVLMIITMAWLFTTSVIWRRHGGGSGEAA